VLPKNEQAGAVKVITRFNPVEVGLCTLIVPAFVYYIDLFFGSGGFVV
jgi:hypothetical protein